MSKKRSVTIHMSEVEYEQLQSEATLSGLSVTAYVRRKIAAPMRPEPVVVEEAFRRLDESDSIREGRMDPPPAPAPKSLPFKILNLGSARSNEQHPCLHHAEVARTDGGPTKVCQHDQQHGRPCYWPSAGAKDCLMFYPEADVTD